MKTPIVWVHVLANLKRNLPYMYILLATPWVDGALGLYYIYDSQSFKKYTISPFFSLLTNRSTPIKIHVACFEVLKPSQNTNG